MSQCEVVARTARPSPGYRGSNYFLAEPPKVYLDQPTYKKHKQRACAGRNELGMFDSATLEDCRGRCDKELGCISFEFSSRNVANFHRRIFKYKHTVLGICTSNSSR